MTDTSWHEHIDRADPDDLWLLSTRLFLAAQQRETEGASPEADVLKLVAAAASMSLTEGAKPVFQPMARFYGENKRSAALEDFGALDAEALAAVAQIAPTALVRARLGDVAATVAAEVGSNQWRSGALAAAAYLELAEQYLLADDGIRVLTEFVRGLRLAWVYCRKDEALSNRYWALIQKAITQSLKGKAPGIAFVLTDEVKRSRSDLATGIAIEMETAAALYLTQGDADTAARCFCEARKLWERTGNRTEAKRCHLLQGEALVTRAALARGSAMANATWLAKGLDVLRRAGADRARIDELRRELATVQQQSLSEFKRTEHSMDATELVRAVEACVVGPTLLESLLQTTFCFGNWPKFDKVRQDVIDAARQYPLSAMFSSQHVNAEGAVIAQQKSFNASDPESVYQAMVKHSHDFECTFRGNIIVARCVDLLFVGHHPSLFHIVEIVASSPMTPPEHEQSLARGTLAGINGDWLEAATYLIPQIEPFIRHQFRLRGVITLAMRDDGIQTEKSLTELLRSDDAERVLGKDLVLELDTLMVHPMGYSLRHNWAHGLSDDRAIVNPGVLALWWTTLRLILWPWAVERHHARQQATKIP